MTARTKTFGSPSGEPNITTRPMPQQMCEKLWTLPLAAARLRHVAGTKWGTRRYLDMNRLAVASEAA